MVRRTANLRAVGGVVADFSVDVEALFLNVVYMEDVVPLLENVMSSTHSLSSVDPRLDEIWR